MQVHAPHDTRLEQACHQQLFTLERKLRTTNLKIEDIGDFIPGNVMVQDLRLRKNIYINKSGCQTLGKSSQELEALGAGYFSLFFAEEEMAVIMPELMRIYELQDIEQVHGFYQRVRKSAAHDYKWYYTCSKLMAPEPGQMAHRLINISNQVDGLGKIVKRTNSHTGGKEASRKTLPGLMALTNREKEIMRYLALGKNPKEIAVILGISRNTVHSHHNNISNKLRISSFAGLMQFASSLDLN